MGESKNMPILMILIAGLIAFAAWDGAGINLLGIDGIKARRAQVAEMRDTLASLQASIDSAKADLARESVEDVRQRTEAYRASLGVLRALVPEQSEVANLIDDINIRAKVRGLQVTNFVPATPVAGPEPFDTHVYQFSVTGRYHQVGQFLTDVASLRRIIVPEAMPGIVAGCIVVFMLTAGSYLT
ncbi:MAG TPA: type 4a pilus biogenesis protein PilO, partial [Gemmatimonadales bacterium]|nr:type 4a pilus biogenesis protein PilO [Gemmatimonadales bacterium]